MNVTSIANATKWSVLCEVISKLISPITTIILARVLAQEVFGIVASITVITSFADLLTDAGFSAYIIQHQFKNKDDYNETINVCFWSNIFISLFIYIILFVNKSVFTKFVGAAGYEKALMIASLVLILTSITSIEMAIMKKELEFKKLGIIKIVSKIIPFFVTVPMALMGFEYWSLIIGTLIGEVVNMFLCFLFGGFIPKIYYSFSKLKEISNFSLWAYFEVILEWLTNNIAIIMISYVFGMYYLGVFKTSITLVNQIVISVYSLYANVYKSSISKAQNCDEEFKKIFYSFQKYTTILSIPLGAGTFIFRDIITMILLGQEWMESSIIIGLWGGVSIISISFGNFYSDAIRAKGYPDKLVFIDFIYILSILVLMFFTRNITFIDFCVLYCLLKLVQPIMQIYIGRKICNIKFTNIVKNCKVQIYATILMTIMGIALKHIISKTIYHVLLIILCVIFYVIVFLLLSRDREKLLRLVFGGRKLKLDDFSVK